MGVKHFYYWYSRAHKSCISRVLSSPVDTLCIDMNGLFHGCAQKVYRYGDFATSVPLSVFDRGASAAGSEEAYRRKLFREVCEKTDIIVRSVKPTGSLLLFVDGVAGLGKMNQQRQRRFRSCQDRASTERSPAAVSAGLPAFNPNQFTPGTALMDSLTKAIDTFIRRKQITDPIWRDIKVVLSNEKVAGEGEHKIMDYLRRNPCPSACIYGMDGDLMMLATLLPVDKVYIARETDYYRWEYVDVEDFSKKIIDEIDWTKDGTAEYSAGSVSGQVRGSNARAFCKKRGMRDFVMMCFLVGNDFLPTTPALSIIDGGLTLLFQVYRSVCRAEGHLTGFRSDRVVLSRKPLIAFLSELARHEKTILERKYNSGRVFHHDPIVVRNSSRVNGLTVIDMDAVADEYYSTKFADGSDRSTIARHYLDGIIWVMNYYEAGMPDWLWCYPHLFGPFIRDLAEAAPAFKPRRFDHNEPVDPMLQLMMVLPPSDQREMVPPVLHMMNNPEHKKYFPDRVEIDMSGKKKDWEGIPIVPFICITDFCRFYTARKKMIPAADARRNIRGKTFVYTAGGCSPLS